jgi:hypothetical protein
LTPGERVVVSGQFRLTEGARINAAPGASANANADGAAK